jgi:hypothetical protein
MGMRCVPRDVHREVLKRDDREFGGEPSWYAVWLGPPHGEASVLLGRAERLLTPRCWRAYPVSGEFPERKRGFIQVINHLLEARAMHGEGVAEVAGSKDKPAKPWCSTCQAHHDGECARPR